MIQPAAPYTATQTAPTIRAKVSRSAAMALPVWFHLGSGRMAEPQAGHW
jgi:hypothetical protein